MRFVTTVTVIGYLVCLNTKSMGWPNEEDPPRSSLLASLPGQFSCLCAIWVPERGRDAEGLWVDAPVVPPLWSDAWDAEEGDHDEGDAARRAPSLREGSELCIYQPKAISHPQLMEQRNINMSWATEQVREERCPRHPRCGAHSTSTEFLPWEKSLEYHTPSSQLCKPIPSALAAVKAGWYSLPIQIVPSQPVGGQNEKIWCLWLTRQEANIFPPLLPLGLLGQWPRIASSNNVSKSRGESL